MESHEGRIERDHQLLDPAWQRGQGWQNCYQKGLSVTAASSDPALAAAALTAPTSLPATRCSARQKSHWNKELSCLNQFVSEAYRLQGRRVVKGVCRHHFFVNEVVHIPALADGKGSARGLTCELQEPAQAILG